MELRDIFAAGTRVRYVGENEDCRGRLATVVSAPRYHKDGRYRGMRVVFDHEASDRWYLTWPDLFEPLSPVELLAELAP